ncbi:hypothetical protein JHK86_005937 [Glycine max]|nr:hypothetical protein JHK86_005937 [Glycine max]
MGYFTCANVMPGSLGYGEQDAKTFASWVWAGPLSEYRVDVVLLNKYSDLRASITALWEDIGLHPSTVVESRDLWEHNTLERQFSGKLTDTVEPHSCKMYVLKPIA